MKPDSRVGGEGGVFLGFSLAAIFLYLLSPINELGDSYHYALAIESGRPGSLVEASHLVWRPLGYVLWTLANHAGWHTGAFAPLRIAALLGSALGVGVAAVWFRRRIGGNPALFAAALFAVGHAWWSYATSACSYPTSVTLSLAALTLVWPEKDRPVTLRALVGAAVLQSMAILVWQPAFLSSLAVVLAASLRREDDRARLSPGIGLALAASMAGLVGVAYLAVWFGFTHDVTETLGKWLLSGRHGQSMELTVLNAARAAYGWTRLFLQPSRLALDPAQHGWGRLFSSRVLWEWGLWRTALVYLFAASAVIVGVLKVRIRMNVDTLLLVVWVLPHLLLAVAFKGTDSERWLHPAPAILAGLALLALGGAPGAVRKRLVCASMMLLAVLGIAARFEPGANMENRPQMRMILDAAPFVRPGDMLYMGGTLDEGQLNRTSQFMWLFSWLYLDRVAVVDVWTGQQKLAHARWEVTYLPGVKGVGREFISERVLAGIQPGDVTSSGAEQLRQSLVVRMPPGPLRRSFSAGGELFYQLLPPGSP